MTTVRQRLVLELELDQQLWLQDYLLYLFIFWSEIDLENQV